MKARIGLWLFLCSLASIATAMSFHAPADMSHYGDKEHAKSLGVSVAEMKKLRKVTGQLSSDVFRKRELLNASDIEYLLKTAARGDSFGIEATFPLILLKGTPYEKEATRIALHGSASNNEHEAYASIGILKYFGDPRWQTFAEVYPWQFKEYKQSIFEVC
jgi:hypothetical protein